MKVYILDTRNRDLKLSVGLVTLGREGCENTFKKGLIVRYAMELGDITSLVRKEVVDLPLIIIGNGYSASQSGGFVQTQFSRGLHTESFLLGEMKVSKSLRTYTLKNSAVSVTLLPPGTGIELIPTTAARSREMRDLILGQLPEMVSDGENVVIAEGDSSMVSLWRLTVPQGQWSVTELDYELDHQTTRWSDQTLVADFLREVAKVKKKTLASDVNPEEWVNLQLSYGEDVGQIQSPVIQHLVGYDKFCEVTGAKKEISDRW